MDGSWTTIIAIITIIIIINDLSSLSPKSMIHHHHFHQKLQPGHNPNTIYKPREWNSEKKHDSLAPTGALAWVYIALHHNFLRFSLSPRQTRNAIVEQCIEAKKSFANVTRLSCSNTTAQSHGTSHYNVTLVQQLQCNNCNIPVSNFSQ